MKALKALVIALALVIVAGIGILVWGMTRTAHPVAANEAHLDAIAAPLELDPPPGMQFEQMSAAGDRLALRFAGAKGQRILLIDPRTGAVTGTISVPATAP
jgi:hypothetical protein